MFRSIIVPLDGSAFGEYALPYATAVARRTGAIVKLLHVHQAAAQGEDLEANPHFRFQGIVEAHAAKDGDARRLERRQLWTIVDRLAAEGVAATAELLTGRVPDSISSYAAESPDALIVMSTHGLSGFHRIWLGSVADAVVRNSSTPVLLVRPSEETPPRADEITFARILAPVDGSPFSAAIIGPLASLAGFEPVEVTFFEVAAPDDAVVALSPIWPTNLADTAPPMDDEYLGKLTRRLPAELAGARARLGVHRHSALAILEEADAGGYDLLAMATHGRGGPHHLLLGSTADKVMRGTTKPILLYRPKQPARVPQEDAFTFDTLTVAAAW